MTFSSAGLTADAATLTRTSPGPGVGFGISVISAPVRLALIARIVSAMRRQITMPQDEQLV